MVRLQKSLLEWREVEGEVIALEQNRSEYLSANRSGTVLWRALATGATESELTDLLAGEFGIERERASADVATFLADLRRRGLLETS